MKNFAINFEKAYMLCIFACALILTGCNNSDVNKKDEQDSSKSNFQPPTATEVFNLRTECAKLGEKILSENHVGIPLTQSQVSKYDLKSNRCFVELFVSSIPTEKLYTSYALYDGQTGEMIAFATDEMGKKKFGSFKVFKKSYEDTLDYIYDVMSDDDYAQKK